MSIQPNLVTNESVHEKVKKLKKQNKKIQAYPGRTYRRDGHTEIPFIVVKVYGHVVDFCIFFYIPSVAS